MDLAQLQKVLDLKADQFLYQSLPCKSLEKYDVYKFQNKQFLSLLYLYVKIRLLYHKNKQIKDIQLDVSTLKKSYFVSKMV
ncbi:Uncharacterised protein [Streptococcus pneumoniae]|nr:Uncharacterised protein [Streptococcus pneumoniae]